jgi:hypothetical protein
MSLSKFLTSNFKTRRETAIAMGCVAWEGRFVVTWA